MTDGPGSETYTYDVMGRITQLGKTIGSAVYNVGYGYNSAGELDALTYPSGRIVTPSYDAIGRLDHLSDAANTYLTGMGYNSAQLPTGFNYGNGVAATFGYNDHLQLSTLKYSLNSADLLNLAYSYQDAQQHNNGQIQGIADARGAAFSTSYSYDGLGRLQQAQTNDLTAANTWRLAWTYDRYGNRLTQSLTGGTISVGQPQLTVDPLTNRISNAGFSYDANGNLTADGNGSYTFDAEGRMVKSVIGTTTTNYSYDGNNLRVVKGSSVYIYSGSKVIAEYASGATPTSPSKEYIYSGSRLLATVTGTAVTYHHPDQLSNRVETNSTGAVTRSFGQLPFGESWYETGSADKWKFTNYEHDSETGLDYAVNRYYGSGYGRFMTADLLGGHLQNPQSLNRYAYVANDPINLVDPLGFDTCVTWTHSFNGGPSTTEGPICHSDAVEIDTDPGEPLVFRHGGGGGGGGGAGKTLPGVNQVKDILNGKNPCAQFFQQGAKNFLGAYTPSASDLFGSDSIVKDKDGPSKLTKSADGNTISQPYAAKTSEGTGANSSIDLNANGAFFNSTAFFANSMGGATTTTGELTIGGTANPRQYAGGSIQAQAAILLHEFAHTINLIPSDGGNPDQSVKNTQKSSTTARIKSTS